MNTLFTIGHSNHETNALLHLLWQACSPGGGGCAFPTLQHAASAIQWAGFGARPERKWAALCVPGTLSRGPGVRNRIHAHGRRLHLVRVASASRAAFETENE